MSNITFKKGNIFSSDKQTIVNTINCVGVMGKGVALGFRLRYPEMYEKYKEFCKNKQITIGKLWLYKRPQEYSKWVLNFPTKFHWKYPSKMEYLEAGLQKFVETYQEKGITSMHFYLDKCSIPIEIYEYDSKAPDELYKQFKDKWMSMSIYDKKNLGIRANQIVVIDKILNDINNSSMTSLSECNGIGIVTLQKCFNLILNYKEQPMLDWK